MRELQIVNAVELAAAYAAAEYTVVIDGEPLTLRVGRRAGDLEAYCPASRYAFITAWNPASQPHSDSANRAADALLAAQLDAVGILRHPAWAQSPSGHWHEPGWLLAGIEEADLMRLAIEFGQAAVLAWLPGKPVRLRMLMLRPSTAPIVPAMEHTDWIAG